MIEVNFNGRLGNQLFQYAFAAATAKKLGTLFFYKEGAQPCYLPSYFQLRYGESVINNIFLRISNWLIKYKKIKVTKVHQNGSDVPEAISGKVERNSSLFGFFQSILYFKNYEKEIKKLFSIKKKYVIQFEAQFGSLFKQQSIIAVHIRRTDYVQYGSESLGGMNLTLPLSYYTNALNCVSNLDKYHIIFLSDDIEFAMNSFGTSPRNHFSKSTEIIDFQILLNADIVIVANSSFSWWGAYLNEKPNKKVIAPKYWSGYKINKEYPNKIIPDNWLTVNV